METVYSLTTRNYKVSATVGVTTVVQTPVRAILDTGAGPNLVREAVLPEDWQCRRLTGEPECRIVGAGGRKLRQKGIIILLVQVGQLRLKTKFIVVEELAAECILGCQFINRHVQTILPKDKKVILSDGSVISILHDSEIPTPQGRQTVKSPDLVPSNKVRVAKFTTLTPRSETHVLVQCAAPGLKFLQASLRGQSLGTYMANGVADIVPLRPFWVRVVNTSTKERRIPKGMVLGHAIRHPQAIVAIADLATDVDRQHKAEEERTTTEVGKQPKADAEKQPRAGIETNATLVEEDQQPRAEEYLSAREPPPLPDRPDVEGSLWKESVALAHLTPQERENVLEMLAKHRSMWDGHLGHVHTTAHRIELTPGASPVHCQPYRAGAKAREQESAEIHRMLQAGVIAPANAEWASPIVMVPKPDGSTRFCVDYRRLNAITVRDSYPLPRMDECIDSLGDARIFSTLDCNAGYWQIPVAKEDIPKTTFTSHEGIFWFLRMPFGLRNAPATFQRFVDITLSGLTWKVCLVYLDDIIVFSRDTAEHMEHLDAVLHRLYSAGLSLNLKKCKFFQESVDYLGHVIRPGKLAVAEKNTKALQTARPPTTQSELRSFLGLCNVYRRFISGFAKIASPLNALLRKGESPQLGVLSKEQLQSFDTLRAKLLNPPILALPRKEGMFTLDTDASNEQIGCCLFQTQPDGANHPVGYWSRGLTRAEKNYSTTEKECLAIVWSILHLRPYLESRHFVVRTDHNSLRWVLNLADAQGRLARWRLRLLEFDFEVQYSPGASHHAADTVSRLRVCDSDNSPSEDIVDMDVPCFTTSTDTPRRDPSLLLREDLILAQMADPACSRLLTDVGVHPQLDVDEFGVLGRVLPSGEFQVTIPSFSNEVPLPITVCTEVPLPPETADVIGDEDAPILRRGVSIALDAPIVRRGVSIASIAASTKFSPSISDIAVTSVDDLPQTIQLEELRREQKNDEECQQLLEQSLVTPGSPVDVNMDGVLIRKAPLDGVEQIIVPHALRGRLLHLEHFPPSVGHPGVTKMFRSMRSRFFWRSLYTDVAEVVRNCPVCSRNRIHERKRTSFLKLFPATEPLEYVAMDILGPLPKTEHGHRFLLVICDRFSKLTRTVPLRSISALVVAKAFCEHWVFVYGPPRYLLTDNGTQFTAKFFLAVCRDLGIAKVFTTAYHPQTNGQVERFNRTILNALRGYVASNQRDWDDYTSTITFGYNCRVHASLGFTPFEIILARPPPPLSVEIPRKREADTPENFRLRFLHRLKELLPLARSRLAESQARYKAGFDKGIREKNKDVSEGSWVFVRREVHETGTNPKLDEQVDGPYKVLQTDGRTFLLRIGDDHVRVSSDRLTAAPTPEGELSTSVDRRRTDESAASGNIPEEGTPTGDVDGSARDNEGVQTGEHTTEDTHSGNEQTTGEYVFERIVGTKQADDGTMLYRVRWFGYTRDDDTWEPQEHLPISALRRYHRRIGLPIPQ